MKSLKHVDLLGLKVTDKVTGFTGVVISVDLKLNGRIEASVQPDLSKDTESFDLRWFDVNRLIRSTERVKEVPNFENIEPEVVEDKKEHAPMPEIIFRILVSEAKDKIDIVAKEQKAVVVDAIRVDGKYEIKEIYRPEMYKDFPADVLNSFIKRALEN